MYVLLERPQLDTASDKEGTLSEAVLMEMKAPTLTQCFKRTTILLHQRIRNGPNLTMGAWACIEPEFSEVYGISWEPVGKGSPV